MDNSWQSLCSKDAIIIRSKLYKRIREFFDGRAVIEVETPLLSDITVTDPFIASFEVFEPVIDYQVSKNKYYLQTSPEFAMKKLLCGNFGSIYQICKAFRSEEQGKNHNQEFSILEWYRVGFDLNALMAEMRALLFDIFNSELSHIKPKDSIKISYTELFKQYLNFDHNIIDIEFLITLIKKLFNNQYDNILNHKEFKILYNKDDLLMILMSEYIEPRLDKDIIYFLYDYPASQAALAKIDTKVKFPVAKRFEVYYQGLELANGYYELEDYNEQQSRFEQDLNRRKQLGLPIVNTDKDLINALKYGLPICSGVAMGLDRILMILLQTSNIENVLTFR